MKKYIIAAGVIVFVSVIFGVKKYQSEKNFLKVAPRAGEITESVYGLGKVKTNQHYELKLGIVSTIQKVLVKYF